MVVVSGIEHSLAAATKKHTRSVEEDNKEGWRRDAVSEGLEKRASHLLSVVGQGRRWWLLKSNEGT